MILCAKMAYTDRCMEQSAVVSINITTMQHAQGQGYHNGIIVAASISIKTAISRLSPTCLRYDRRRRASPPALANVRRSTRISLPGVSINGRYSVLLIVNQHVCTFELVSLELSSLQMEFDRSPRPCFTYNLKCSATCTQNNDCSFISSMCSGWCCKVSASLTPEKFELLVSHCARCA